MSFRHIRNARGFFSDYYLGAVFGREGGRGRRRRLSDRTTWLAERQFFRLYERIAGKELSAFDCRERFVRPLLRDLFGLLLDDEEDGLQSLRPSPALDAEAPPGPTPAVGLAWIGGSSEGLDGRHRKGSPGMRLEQALSRRGLRYGLVATGERLRLIRAPGEGAPGAYLELDLAGLAADPDPESFAAALRLFSAASLLPGVDGVVPLDYYATESRRHAEKVSEDLKRAVFSAAERLAGGLLADVQWRGAIADATALSRDELGRYRDAALVALYRLLFILYAEARDPRLDEHRLYHEHYSASGLVDELFAEPLREWPGNRSSLWARCLALFEIYDRGLPPIDPWRHIPPRGGDFFRPDTSEGALLAAARLPDALVARTVLDLATTAPRPGIGRERVSFRELDIESLGAVYEGLLELEPRVAREPTVEVSLQGRLFGLTPDELARLCRARRLRLQGPPEWVTSTAAAPFFGNAAEDGDGGDDESDEADDETETEVEETEDTAEADESQDDAVAKGGTARLLRRLERGSFHFVPGPGRKGSGSFYTPLPLVQDLVRHALGPMVSGRSAAEIEALRVLDPACGSGHFLVESMRFLGQELHRAYVREHGAAGPPAFRRTTDQGWDGACEASDADARASASEARAWCKRRVAERCLFGIDWNPTAVTLAHVALWIESAAGDRPLTYFEHHVRCGNSLLGSWLDRLDVPPFAKAAKRERADSAQVAVEAVKAPAGSQRDLFAGKLRRDLREALRGLDEQIAAARKLRRLIDAATPEDLEKEGIDPESLEEQRYKDGLRRQSEAALASARLLFDLRSAALFEPEVWRDWPALTHLLADPAELEREARGHSWWPAAAELRERYRFFHWELEFPEVFLADDRPGFDVVLGNPPWDKVLPERHAFYGRFDPLIRAFKGAELDRRIRELDAADSSLSAQFDAFQGETKRFAQFLRSGGDFPYAEARSQAAHEDVSKYFLDRAVRLVAPGGALGLLLPSVVYNGDGCVGLRKYLLTEGRIERFYAFENHGKRFFPIHASYKFVNLVFRRGAAPQPFDAAFMRRDPEELTAATAGPWMVRLSCAEIERYSPETFAFLEYRGPRDQEIVAKMYRGRPTLGASADVAGSWGVRLVSWRAHEVIFNASEDKDLWSDPVTGRLLSPETVLGVKPPTLNEILEQMRAAGYWPVFEGKNVDQFLIGTKPIRWWLSVEAAERKYGKRPRAQATLVFRETASNTNERTCIAVVLPPLSCATHKLSGVLVEEVAEDAAASVLNSLCFDFALRLRTAGTNISFTYMNPMPVPPASLVRGLPTFPTGWAWKGGISHVTGNQDLWPRLWASNRAVAEAYGLDGNDFLHILYSFPTMAKKRKELVAHLANQAEQWVAEPHERLSPEVPAGPIGSR